jgi:hypothetical protein
MEKFYPPIHIRQILEHPDKTQVWVQFYECSEEDVIKGMKKNKNAEAVFKEEKVFTLPKMNADEAREAIYKQLNHKKIKI